MTLEYLKYMKVCKRYNVTPLPLDDETGPELSAEDIKLHADLYNEANKPKRVSQQRAQPGVSGKVFTGLLLGTGLLANALVSTLGIVLKPNSGE